MPRHDTVYLRHIRQAIQNIQEFIDGMTYKTFKADKKTTAAVQRQLEIIGEAMAQLSDPFRKKHPDFPFADAISMRNILIHEYFGVDPKVVWDTCRIDLPPLLIAIEKGLESEENTKRITG